MDKTKIIQTIVEMPLLALTTSSEFGRHAFSYFASLVWNNLFCAQFGPLQVLPYWVLTCPLLPPSDLLRLRFKPLFDHCTHYKYMYICMYVYRDQYTHVHTHI